MLIPIIHDDWTVPGSTMTKALCDTGKRLQKAELGWLRLAGETKLAERKVDLELLTGFAHEA